MTKIYTLLFILLAASSCKTATKAYDKGDYSNAIELAIKKLQKDPSDGETKALLQNAYTFAVKNGEEKIRSLSAGTSESRYEQIYNEYRSLQQLYSELVQHSSLTSHIKPIDYSSYVATYQQKAADVHYEKGLTFMAENTKRSYQQAYRAFAAAQRLNKGDTAIRNRMNEAYDLAVTRVVILPIRDNYGSYGSYSGYQVNNSYQLRNFSEDVVRNLQFGAGNEFIKFYNEWDARNGNIEADEVLEMHFNRLEIGRPYDQTQTRTVSNEVVVKEIVYRPDSVVKQYGRVTATINTTRRTMVSQGDLYVTSRDMSGRILWNDVFRGEHRWQVEFATYRGDERALSNSDKALLNRYDTNEPREEEVVEGVLRQINSDMNYRLRSYFDRSY